MDHCRTVDDSILLIKNYGLPEEISFDHDLGENQKTGYDLAKWIVENLIDISNVSINVHSANPIGRDHIYGLLNNWKKFCQKNKEN